MLNLLNKVTIAIEAKDRAELVHLRLVMETRILSEEEYQALDALISAGIEVTR